MGAALALREEFTGAQWAEHQRSVPHAVIICNGKAQPAPCTVYGEDGQGLGFICRGEQHSCGRYICACFGGSTDNRCCACWVRHDKAQRRLPVELREAEFQ